MKISRRRFINLGTKGLLGGIIASSGVPALLRSLKLTDGNDKSVSAADSSNNDWERHYWEFVCDNEKCIGCGRCVVACKLENKVPWESEFNRTWVERYIVMDNGEILVDSPHAGRDGFTTAHESREFNDLEIRKSFFVPKLCNQCENPPCVTVCPVGATYMTKDGVILVDKEHCIGCRYCIQACPYGARYILPEEHVVDKCNWCYHRITKGLLPACVQVCPVEARVFGDMLDPGSRVRKILTERRVYTLKPDLGTEPKVYYVGFEKGVH